MHFVLQLFTTTAFWRELLVLGAVLLVLLVLLVRRKSIRQRWLFLVSAVLAGAMLARLRDVLMDGMAPGWRHSKPDGGVGYDFVTVLIMDFYWALGLLVSLLLLPWLMALLPPFRERRAR